MPIVLEHVDLQESHNAYLLARGSCAMRHDLVSCLSRMMVPWTIHHQNHPSPLVATHFTNPSNNSQLTSLTRRGRSTPQHEPRLQSQAFSLQESLDTITQRNLSYFVPRRQPCALTGLCDIERI